MSFCAVLFYSCSDAPTNTPTQKSDPGSAAISIQVGRVGSLGKVRNVELKKLYLSLSAPGETTILDSADLSGNSGATVTKDYSNLASLLKTWTLSAETRDANGVVIHSGSTQFIVPARNTIPVTLNLTAKYSILRANYFPIQDSVTRCVLLVNGIQQDDSSFAKQTILGDTVRLSYAYLNTGVAQRIKLNVYGTMFGFDTLLYTGDTLVTPLAGTNANYSILLKWSGPALPPAGEATMRVTIGSVGSVSVDGQLIDPVPTSGLIAYYPLNGNANDATGNGNNGMVNGAVAATDRLGNANSAISFNGVDDYIRTNNLSTMSAMSISFWFYLRTIPNDPPAMLVSNGQPWTEGQGIEIYTASWGGGHINSRLGNGVTPYNSGYFTPWETTLVNKWIHYTLTYSGTKIQIFIDGVLKVDDSYSGDIVPGTLGYLYFGCRPYGTDYAPDGVMDDIRIYNRALNSSEVQSLYHESGYMP